MSDLDDLRQLGLGGSLTSSQVFDAVFAAGSVLSDNDREEEEALEIAIRLLEARRNRQVPEDCDEVIEYLAEECGLYPYIKLDRFSLITQTVVEAHAIDLGSKMYLHSKQMQILLWLLAGDNVVLSAPTSFGKSLLVDAFLSRKRPHTVLVILPTIALIDETRRRLKKNFAEYKLITTVSEPYVVDRPTIFILTQERFLQREKMAKIDFLFVDEFYKLDPGRDDQRFETLNLALYRALPQARQSFMAGPHIYNINLGAKWNGNFRFVRTDYRTVTVNIIDRSRSKERFQTFLADLRSVGDESSLVFTATPGSAQKLMNDLIDADFSFKSAFGVQLASWITENYHPDWPISKCNERGIALHHGRIPRSLGQLFVQLFNYGVIKVLICTSTLIEGVNTGAANVFVYDKKINRSDFDFFSFANIRGRVGRMMRHFVGNAFLYHEPPREVETHVDVPILSNPGSTSEYLLMNVDGEDLTEAGRDRRDNIAASSKLSSSILKDHGIIGVEILTNLYEKITTILAESPLMLEWTGIPNKDQRRTVAELCLFVAHKRRDTTGLHTPAQVAWAWSQLATIDNLPKYLRWFVEFFSRDKKAVDVDAAFQFLQACEFSFPRTLSAVEDIIRAIKPHSKVSFLFYIGSLENWFRPAWMKELDEMGIPIPLAERLAPLLAGVANRADAWNAIEHLDLDKEATLGEIDRFIIRLAIA